MAILPEAMTEANKMVNSTMKMVRSRVVERYEATIQNLYKPEMKDIMNDANREALKTFLDAAK